MPRIAMPPIQRSVTSWKWRQSRPAGCSIVQAFWSGMVQRPEIRLSSSRSLASGTTLAVGLTELSGLRCCALAGAATATMSASARAPRMKRTRVVSLVMLQLPSSMRSPDAGSCRHRVHVRLSVTRLPRARLLRRDRLAIRRLPAPGAGAVAALDHALLIDLGDDLAVAGEQRFGRAHFRAQRQLALGQTICSVFHEFRLGAVLLRPAGAIGALVHLAAGAEVADLGILRGAERAGVEAIAAADADVLRMQHHAVGSGVERIRRTDRLARRVGAVHAGDRDRALAGLSVVQGDDPAAVDAPRHL